MPTYSTEFKDNIVRKMMPRPPLCQNELLHLPVLV